MSGTGHPLPESEEARHNEIPESAEARKGDIVLLAGKGHETVQIIGNQTLPFDDAEVARECAA